MDHTICLPAHLGTLLIANIARAGLSFLDRIMFGNLFVNFDHLPTTSD